MGAFTDWLLQQVDRNDPVGDLAADVTRDPDWPGSSRSLSRLLVYLRSICEPFTDNSSVAAGACPGCWYTWRSLVGGCIPWSTVAAGACPGCWYTCATVEPARGQSLRCKRPGESGRR